MIILLNKHGLIPNYDVAKIVGKVCVNVANEVIQFVSNVNGKSVKNQP